MLLDHGVELRVLDEEVLLSAGASGGAATLELLFQHSLEEPHPEIKILQRDHFSHIHESWRNAYNYSISDRLRRFTELWRGYKFLEVAIGGHAFGKSLII